MKQAIFTVYLAPTTPAQRGNADSDCKPDDSTTANCLINLHYTQSDACISVAGSSCEAIKGTSQILNARMGYAKYLSADDSDTLQAASGYMIGRTVSSGYSDDGGISSGVVELVRVGQNAAQAGLDFRFDGDQEC